MKKILLISICCLFFINVQAKNLIKVKLDKCVDGDTAWFVYKNKSAKFRFLAINTPESTNKIETYGKEASNFTCNELKKAQTIEVEFDNNSNKQDKYNRYLAWIFVDGELLQSKIIENGYAEVKYLYGDYKYTDILKEKEKIAKNNKIGIFSSNEENNNFIIEIIIIIIVVFLFIFNSKFRKKTITKIKRKGKSVLKKNLKL